MCDARNDEQLFKSLVHKHFKNPFVILAKLVSSQAFFNVSSCSFVLKQKNEKFKAGAIAPHALPGQRTDNSHYTVYLALLFVGDLKGFSKCLLEVCKVILRNEWESMTGAVFRLLSLKL